MIVNQFEANRMDPLLKKFRLQQLRPPPEVEEITWTEQQIFVESSGQRKRKIYFNTPFDSEEKREIEQVKARLVNVQLEGVFSDPAILKQLYAVKHDIGKAVERLKQGYKFLSDPQVARLSYRTEEDLKKGFAYTFGYSRNFRPILYVRPDLINFSDDHFFNSIYVLFYICQRYRMVPYHCEKLFLVIDLNHMRVSQIPLTKIYDMLKKIHVCYTENAQKIIVLNSSGLGTVWFFVSRMMKEQARKRVCFPSKMSDLDEFISPDQREEKYAGSLPNLTHYWYFSRNAGRQHRPTTMLKIQPSIKNHWRKVWLKCLFTQWQATPVILVQPKRHGRHNGVDVNAVYFDRNILNNCKKILC